MKSSFSIPILNKPVYVYTDIQTQHLADTIYTKQNNNYLDNVNNNTSMLDM